MTGPRITKFGRLSPGLPKITKNAGKGGGSEMLPSRHAVSQLVKGNPIQRSMGNYAKLTPSGASAPMNYQTIIDMGQTGADMAAALDPKDGT